MQPKLSAITVAVPAILLSFAVSVHGRPVFDTNCSSCHTPTTGRMEVTDHDIVLDPGPGALKTFIVNAGSSVRMTARVINGEQAYAVQFKDLGLNGVLNPAHEIQFTPDPDWIEWGSPPYYIITTNSVPWTGSAADWSFDLLVSEDTPPDFYRFQFTISGRLDDTLWTQSEAIYVQVLPVPEPGMMTLAWASCLTLLLRRRRT